MEVHDLIDDAQGPAGHHWTSLILNSIQQAHNVASIDRFDWPCAECWIDKASKGCLGSSSTALILCPAQEILLRDRLESLLSLAGGMLFRINAVGDQSQPLPCLGSCGFQGDSAVDPQ